MFAGIIVQFLFSVCEYLEVEVSLQVKLFRITRKVGCILSGLTRL